LAALALACGCSPTPRQSDPAATATATASPRASRSLFPDHPVDCTPEGWCRLEEPPGMSIMTMWVGDDALWVGGRLVPEEDDWAHGAMIARWNGRAWTRWPLDAPGVAAIDGQRGAVWATGAGGQIWSFQAGGWRMIERRTNEGYELAIGADGDIWVAGWRDIAHRMGDGCGPWLDAPLHHPRERVVALGAGVDGTIAALTSPPDMDTARLEIWGRDPQRFVPHGTPIDPPVEFMAVRAKDDVVVGTDNVVLRWDGQTWRSILSPPWDHLDVRALAYRGQDVLVVARAWRGYWTETGLVVIGGGENRWLPLNTDRRDLRMAGPRVIAVGPDQSLWVGDALRGTVWFRRP
jgi:hypothetical protein